MSNSPYERACNVLGVAPEAELAVIQDQYRFLAFVFHPDRIPSGAMRARVERHLKEINNARDYLVKYHAERTPLRSAATASATDPDVARPGKTSPDKNARSSGAKPDPSETARKRTSSDSSKPPPSGAKGTNSGTAANQGRWWQPPPGYGGKKTGWRRGVSGFWEDGEWHASKSSQPGPAPEKAQPRRTSYKGVEGGYWADGEWHPNKKN